MTRFSTTTTTDVGGHALTIMSRPEEAGDPAVLRAIAALPGLLEEARTALTLVSAVLGDPGQHPRLARIAQQLFLTDAARIADEDLQHIKATFTLIHNGLNSDVTLKIGTVIGKEDVDRSDGAVMFRPAHDKHAAKPYTTIVQAFDPNPGLFQSSTWIAATGAIRLTRQAVTGTTPIRNLVHEASHKYAGTGDYRYLYFDPPDFVSRTTPMTDRKKALRNADSYGYLAQYIHVIAG